MVKNGNEDGVCRDFLRNVCRRGNKCKFRHPEQGEEAKGDLQFCHDYQNKMCTRSNCKFVHCSKEDEEYYHQTGDLPPGVEEAAAKKSAADGGDGDIPVCRDYQKGECKRGSSCKYRHMSRGDVEFEERMRRRQPRASLPPLPDRYSDEYEHERYRRWLEHSRYEDFERMDRDRFYREREPRESRESREPRDPPPHGYDSRPGRDARELEEENAILRRKNEELRKTVADLTSTNDVLLEQNARLRALRAEATSAVLQAETHLVNSTASAGPPLSQGRSLGSSTHHTVAATAPVMYPARAAQVPLGADNTLSALSASMAQRPGHVVPMSVGATASMVSYPMVSQTHRTVMS